MTVNEYIISDIKKYYGYFDPIPSIKFSPLPQPNFLITEAKRNRISRIFSINE